MNEPVIVTPRPRPTTGDALAEITRLLGLLCRAQGIRIAPIVPLSPTELEGWRKIGEEFADLARLRNDQRNPGEVAVFDESGLPPAGGTLPPRLRKRR